MIKLSKRMQIIKKNIIPQKIYDINKGIKIIKKLSKVKFIETIETSIHIEIDKKNQNQNIKGYSILPYKINKNTKIVAFVDDKYIKEAHISGVDIIGTEKTINDINNKNINFDIIIASPNKIKLLRKVGHILGPKNLMPNIKYGTITSNISQTIKNIKNGQINYKNDKNGIIHTIIGKINFTTYNIKENLKHLIKDIIKNKPINCKGEYIKKINISSTMGGNIVINKQTLFI